MNRSNLLVLLHSLGRHRLMVLLLALEVAFTCAIVCNVVFLIALHARELGLPSGLAEDQLGVIAVASLDEGGNRIAEHRQILARLRAIDGVTAAGAVDSLPLSHHSWINGVSAGPDSDDRVPAAAYDGEPGERRLLGLQLVAGRDFLDDEYRPMDSAAGWTGLEAVPTTIISRALARRLYPDGQAVGKDIYVGAGHPLRVVGVVAHLLKPALGDPAENEYTMLFPMLPDEPSVMYVLRSAPGQRQAVLAAARRAILAGPGTRVIEQARTYTQLREDSFNADQRLIATLLVACACLLFVTGLGIAGLAGFWVQSRTRAIGIRRALGATRGQVLRYFQLENGLIVGAGIVTGVVFAYALNLGLMQWFELPRLPAVYAVGGMTALWLLGQLAVLGPALRAAQVPPALATRSL